MFTQPQKIVAGLLSTQMHNLSIVLGGASVVLDGPKYAAANTVAFVAKEAAEIFGSEEVGEEADFGSQLKTIYSSIREAEKTIKMPLSLLFDILGDLASQGAQVLSEIRNDPPDPHYTVVASPPDFSINLPNTLQTVPNYPVFAAAISSFEACDSLWDAELTAGQRYEGAILAGDLTSAGKKHPHLALSEVKQRSVHEP